MEVSMVRQNAFGARRWTRGVRGFASSAALLAGIAATRAAHADPAVQVDATANVFAAGLDSTDPAGGGAPPVQIDLGAAGPGRTITFSVSGPAVSCCGFAGPHGADGGYNLSTHIAFDGGVSGIVHDTKNLFLLGVFLDEDAPIPGAAPPDLRYTDAAIVPEGALSDHEAAFAPQLRQTFFVGDGRTGDGAGAAQVFAIPDGATRLFLGFADGLNVGDPTLGTPSPVPPGYYGDNTGTVDVTYTLASPCAFACGAPGAPDPLDDTYCGSETVLCSCANKVPGQAPSLQVCTPAPGFCGASCGYDFPAAALECISVGLAGADCNTGAGGGPGGGLGGSGGGAGGSGPGGGSGGSGTGGGSASEPCPCEGTGFTNESGDPVDTDVCGQVACGADDFVWMCTLQGWQSSGAPCAGSGGNGAPPSCACNTAALGGRSWVTHTCGRIACDGQSRKWLCTPNDFVPIGTLCDGACPAGGCAEEAPTPVPTPALLRPAIVFGQPTAKEAVPGAVVANRAYLPAGVAIDRSAFPHRLFVWDSGNDRILGFTAAGTCHGLQAPCTRDADCGSGKCDLDPERPADIAIGQSSLTEAGCNRDDVKRRDPTRATLCGQPSPDGISRSAAPVSMAVDGQGRLFVADVRNHRVLRFDAPFTSDTKADRVLGQEDGKSGDCNRGAAGPTASSLCLVAPEGGPAGAGVDVDSQGRVWVADTGNRRVLVFPKQGKAASFVLGQASATDRMACSNIDDPDRLCAPRAVRVDPASGQAYVLDGPQPGTRSYRVVVYPPSAWATTGKPSAIVRGRPQGGVTGYGDGGLLGWFRWSSPSGIALSPASPGGFWLADAGNDRIVHYAKSGASWLETGVLGKQTLTDFGSSPACEGPGTPADQCQLRAPSGNMDVDDDGRLWATEIGRHRTVVFPAGLSQRNGPTAPKIAGEILGGSRPWRDRVEAAVPNQPGPHDLIEASGVALLRGPGKPAVRQLVALDGRRALTWNGYLQRSTGDDADGVIGQVDLERYEAPSPEHGFRAAAAGEPGEVWLATRTEVRLHAAPLDASEQPSAALGPDLVLGCAGCAGQIHLQGVTGIAYDGARDSLYVADGAAHRVLRVDDPRGFAEVTLVLGQDGPAATGPNRGTPVSLLSGECQSKGPGGKPAIPADGFANMSGIRLDQAGNLYVVDAAPGGGPCSNNRVVMYTAADLAKASGFPKAAELSPRYVYAGDGTGALDAPGTRANGPGQPNTPLAVAFSPKNEMVLVADPTPGLDASKANPLGGRVFYYDNPTPPCAAPKGKACQVSARAVLPIHAARPVDAAFDDKGNLAVADRAYHRVTLHRAARLAAWVEGEACTPGDSACPDLDPCAVRHGGCRADQLCAKLGPTTAACACPPGTSESGTACAEIDDCALSPCPDGQSCVDRAGGRECYCPPGQLPDGAECVPSPAIPTCAPEPYLCGAIGYAGGEIAGAVALATEACSSDGKLYRCDVSGAFQPVLTAGLPTPCQACTADVTCEGEVGVCGQRGVLGDVTCGAAGTLHACARPSPDSPAAWSEIAGSSCDPAVGEGACAYADCDPLPPNPGDDPCADDLSVAWISRSPRLPFDPDAADPTVQGWPSVGEPVTWTGHLRNRSGRSRSQVSYRFSLDGAVIAGGKVDVLALDAAEVSVVLPWSFERHALRLEVDPYDTLPETSEANNALTIDTDALSIAFYVERTLHDHMDQTQFLLGIGSNTWEDWAQRQVRLMNQIFENSVYPGLPTGVLDRVRLDQVYVVDDGALPLVGVYDKQYCPDYGSVGPKCIGHVQRTNNPDVTNRTVDLMWGFPSTLLDYFGVTPQVIDTNPAYLDPALLHELGHARGLPDIYRWDLRVSQVEVEENGQRIAGTPLLPVAIFDQADPLLYTDPDQGLMKVHGGPNLAEKKLSLVGTLEMNQWFHERPRYGNYNAPFDYFDHVRVSPEVNVLELRDASGAPLSGATVWLYRAGTVPGGRLMDGVEDAVLTADADGKVVVGHCPFTSQDTFEGATPKDPCAIGTGAQQGILLVRAQKDGLVGYAVVSSLDFAVAYMRGAHDIAVHPTTVRMFDLSTIGM